MLISNRCISGLMTNLMKKSWTVSNRKAYRGGTEKGESERIEGPSSCICMHLVSQVVYGGIKMALLVVARGFSSRLTQAGIAFKS